MNEKVNDEDDDKIIWYYLPTVDYHSTIDWALLGFFYTIK